MTPTPPTEDSDGRRLARFRTEGSGKYYGINGLTFAAAFDFMKRLPSSPAFVVFHESIDGLVSTEATALEFKVPGSSLFSGGARGLVSMTAKLAEAPFKFTVECHNANVYTPPGGQNNAACGVKFEGVKNYAKDAPKAQRLREAWGELCFKSGTCEKLEKDLMDFDGEGAFVLADDFAPYLSQDGSYDSGSGRGR